MGTSRYETYILYRGMTPISSDATHSPETAVALVRALALKHYRYLGEGSFWEYEARAFELAGVSKAKFGHQLLSVYAVPSGAVLESGHVTLAALFSARFQKRLSNAFPGARCLAIICNDRVGDFAFAVFEGNSQRRLWSTRDWIRADLLEEGEVQPEELETLQQVSAKRAWSRLPVDHDDGDSSSDQIVVGEQIYDLDDALRYFELLTTKLSGRFVEPGGRDRVGSGSFFVRRPWWREIGIRLFHTGR